MQYTLSYSLPVSRNHKEERENGRVFLGEEGTAEKVRSAKETRTSKISGWVNNRRGNEGRGSEIKICDGVQ